MKPKRILKFASRLVLNNFLPHTTYSELLGMLKWQPIYSMVTTRRLRLTKKYMDRSRHLPSPTIFPLKEANLNRHSQRLAERSVNHSLMLLTFDKQKNSTEDKMACAHMRRLWNSMDEADIRLPFSKFKETVSSTSIMKLLCERGVVNAIDV